jgi:hypothetical protein
MIWYRFEDGMLWKQHRVPCRNSPSRTRVVAQRPVPFMLDTTRSHDEVVFTSMLRDYFAGDALAELQASLMGSRIVNLFPNKRRAGNWTISEDDLAVAVIESLVRHKLAVLCAPIEIEYLGGHRQDNIRDRLKGDGQEGEAPLAYKRSTNEFNTDLAKCMCDGTRDGGRKLSNVERSQAKVDAWLKDLEEHRAKGEPTAFEQAFQKTLDKFKKPHSRWWWYRLVAIEFLHQCVEVTVEWVRQQIERVRRRRRREKP